MPTNDASASVTNTGTPQSKRYEQGLLDLDRPTHGLELRLQFLCLLHGQIFLQRLGRAFDELLGFLQTQSRHGTHFLDDLYFGLGIEAGELDIELGLFFDDLLDRRRCTTAATTATADAGRQQTLIKSEMRRYFFRQFPDFQQVEMHDLMRQLMDMFGCHDLVGIAARIERWQRDDGHLLAVLEIFLKHLFEFGIVVMQRILVDRHNIIVVLLEGCSGMDGPRAASCG
mmetsp:Transcript_15949/g.44118  ORF Transcript_15949/g.44118 Transcript_15949/m.44118 type:complete len:228 (+) Transcript_15949:250-933(+)